LNGAGLIKRVVLGLLWPLLHPLGPSPAHCSRSPPLWQTAAEFNRRGNQRTIASLSLCLPLLVLSVLVFSAVLPSAAQRRHPPGFLPPSAFRLSALRAAPLDQPQPLGASTSRTHRALRSVLPLCLPLSIACPLSRLLPLPTSPARRRTHSKTRAAAPAPACLPRRTSLLRSAAVVVQGAAGHIVQSSLSLGSSTKLQRCPHFQLVHRPEASAKTTAAAGGLRESGSAHRTRGVQVQSPSRAHQAAMAANGCSNRHAAAVTRSTGRRLEAVAG
jgi:hypothetical protein